MDQSPPISLVYVDTERRTIRPTTDAGDDYFGLGPGSNGTAKATRRALVEPEPGYVWVRFNGAPATGTLYVPTGKVPRDCNPWSGGIGE